MLGVNGKRSSLYTYIVEAVKRVQPKVFIAENVGGLLTLEQVAEKADLSANYIGMVERGLKEPGLATIVKILNALNISADELLCDLVPSASHVTDDEISKRLEGLTPMQKKVALDLLDTYITNLPYLTKEE